MGQKVNYTGFGLFIKLMKIFPQHFRSFPGIHEDFLFFHEFSRDLEENFKIPKFSRNSRSSPRIPGVFQEFQEFSKNSRSTEHHENLKL